MLACNSTNSPISVQVVLIVSDQVHVPALWEISFQENGFTTLLEPPENALHACSVVDPALTIVDTSLSHRKRLAFCSNLRAIASGPIILLVSDYNSNQMADIYNLLMEIITILT